MSNQKALRCAIYTRKSTEDGLEQDFNSLDAQREACEAYIASQASLGWKLLKTRYDDGGISGGTMERPALKQLLLDIEAGRVDVVVVYKIDRLTRALMDFSRIVDVFDASDVSFVSITQQFNTTTSMGRLTLNVLLSFAQFEREVTAERIRDKIAASKKKGMWMGGPPPLGYDVVDKALVINNKEAESVRTLFRLYCQCRNVHGLKQQADKLRILTKRRKWKDGSACGQKPFARGNLYALLSNPLYIGKVAHHGETYPGQHEAIVGIELWDAVQGILASNRRERLSPTNNRSASILTGIVFDETGDRLSPSHAIKNGIRYRYYISNRIVNRRDNKEDGWRIPAKEIEGPVLRVLQDHLCDPLKLVRLIDLNGCTALVLQSTCLAADRLARKFYKSTPTELRNVLASFITRVTLHPDRIEIGIHVSNLRPLLTGEGRSNEQPGTEHQTRNIELPHTIRRRGIETKLVMTSNDARESNPDLNLIKTIARAHLWLNELTSGRACSIDELACKYGEDRNEISRFLSLAHLAPDIVNKIIEGTQPIDLTLKRVRRLLPLPNSWNEQREILGFAQH